MNITDPIADYLTRVRNAVIAKHRIVEIPASKLKKEITKILKGTKAFFACLCFKILVPCIFQIFRYILQKNRLTLLFFQKYISLKNLYIQMRKRKKDSCDI